MRAIEAALTLVNGLLAEEETLTQELLSALPETHTPAAHQNEPPQHKKPPEERAPRSKEEERLHGIEESLTPLVSSAEQSRRLLTHFETQLPELRRHLATSNGWFETFFVPKRHPKRSIMAYATALEQEQTQGRPIPEELAQSLHPEVIRLLRRGISPLAMPRNLREEVYDITQLGPYVRYRWREANHISTISLGVLDDYPPFPFIPDGF